MKENWRNSHSSGEDEGLEEVAFAKASVWNGCHLSSDQVNTNYFKSAEWSPDGTCVITNSADNHIRTYVIPPDLLDDLSAPHNLAPYSVIKSFEPVNVMTCYPLFDLQNSATTLVLSAASEHPLRLSSALTGDLVASYPLISSTTEAHIKPYSVVFNDGGSFTAGCDSLISMFDLSRPGQEPIQVFRTGPKSNKNSWSNPATSLRGIVSALSLDREYNILAAGTLSRQVGLYDSRGQGECVGVFSVKTTEADLNIGGGGITQLKWSVCGRYLYIVERKSNGAIIYDIRQSGQLVSWLEGRKATTNQRMSIDIKEKGLSNGNEVWAGGTDGCLRCWKAPHLAEGAVPVAKKYALHSDTLNNVSLHREGDVIATASGQRHFGKILENSYGGHEKYETTPVSELKLWNQGVRYC